MIHKTNKPLSTLLTEAKEEAEEEEEEAEDKLPDKIEDVEEGNPEEEEEEEGENQLPLLKPHFAVTSHYTGQTFLPNISHPPISHSVFIVV